MGNLAEQKRYTYADYIRWDNKTRYELIDGTAYAMASPSRTHQKISRKLVVQLDNFLRGKTCEVYYAPFDVRLNSDSFDDIVVQPDVFVVCDESKHDGKSVKGAPDMIIEILSPFNAQHDIITKTRLYRKAGVREYWIVAPRGRTVQVYILANGKYIVSDYNDGDMIPVHVLHGCEINLADVFYDTVESESAGSEIELAIRQKIIEAFKETGVSDKKIEKAVKKLNNPSPEEAGVWGERRKP
jgi:Uma2 family endonuclease